MRPLAASDLNFQFSLCDGPKRYLQRLRCGALLSAVDEREGGVGVEDVVQLIGVIAQGYLSVGLQRCVDEEEEAPEVVALGDAYTFVAHKGAELVVDVGRPDVGGYWHIVGHLQVHLDHGGHTARIVIFGSDYPGGVVDVALYGEGFFADFFLATGGKEEENSECDCYYSVFHFLMSLIVVIVPLLFTVAKYTPAARVVVGVHRVLVMRSMMTPLAL